MSEGVPYSEVVLLCNTYYCVACVERGGEAEGGGEEREPAEESQREKLSERTHCQLH